MTDEKISEYEAFFGDLWQFFKKYRVKHIGNAAKEDRAWEVVLEKVRELDEKYKDLSESDFVRKMLCTVLRETETLYRKEIVE